MTPAHLELSPSPPPSTNPVKPTSRHVPIGTMKLVLTTCANSSLFSAPAPIVTVWLASSTRTLFIGVVLINNPCVVEKPA